MANHKRHKAKNRRAGCLMCKPWKMNGHGKNKPDHEAFSDHVRRQVAQADIKAAGAEGWGG